MGPLPRGGPRGTSSRGLLTQERGRWAYLTPRPRAGDIEPGASSEGPQKPSPLFQKGAFFPIFCRPAQAPFPRPAPPKNPRGVFGWVPQKPKWRALRRPKKTPGGSGGFGEGGLGGAPWGEMGPGGPPVMSPRGLKPKGGGSPVRVLGGASISPMVGQKTLP